ncbi:signal recognition particle subunit SRP68-like [Apostichopus japonicus]|uniref:signal recognition particle subunit SRP68-like n=1 Tax=Stichopus japonicus TaxID=307972 RepID=UPI003AB7A391
MSVLSSSEILDRLQFLTADHNCSIRSVAYIAQQAWIQNDTVRGNVLFGKDLNSTKYEKILQACPLQRDLEVLSGGDSIEIGEKLSFKGNIIVEVEELDTLAQDINGLNCSAQAASILDSNEPSISKGMAQLSLKDNRPLVERLDRYNANQPDLAAKPNFTAFPPDFKPSPCKLLFFDIALNHIELPSLDEKLEQNKSAAQGGGVWVGSCIDGGAGVKSNSRFAQFTVFGKKLFAALDED